MKTDGRFLITHKPRISVKDEDIFHTQVNTEIKVDDTARDGFSKVPISSHWAYGHQNAPNAHYQSEVDDGDSGTADTISWLTGWYHKSTMTGNCTYTFTAPSGPCRLQLRLVQDGTGGRTAVWPNTVKWPSKIAPTLSTAANAEDILTFWYSGSYYYGAIGLDYGVPP